MNIFLFLTGYIFIASQHMLHFDRAINLTCRKICGQITFNQGIKSFLNENVFIIFNLKERKKEMPYFKSQLFLKRNYFTFKLFLNLLCILSLYTNLERDRIVKSRARLICFLSREMGFWDFFPNRKKEY